MPFADDAEQVSIIVEGETEDHLKVYVSRLSYLTEFGSDLGG